MMQAAEKWSDSEINQFKWYRQTPVTLTVHVLVYVYIGPCDLWGRVAS